MVDPENVDSVLISNRSFCQLQLGYAEGALNDAHLCRAMRPGCAHSCWLQGYSYVILQVIQNRHLFKRFFDDPLSSISSFLGL
jgi:hypothetical protein